MFVIVDERTVVAGGYASSFDREGISSAGIDPAEFRDWIATYNRTGIANDSRPSAELIASIGDPPVVVCSDYLRSIESAACLCPSRQPIVSATFRGILRRAFNADRLYSIFHTEVIVA